MKAKQQSGFTLIELIMVIVILGIMAAVAIPQFVDLRGEARTASAEGVAGALGGHQLCRAHCWQPGRHRDHRRCGRLHGPWRQTAGRHAGRLHHRRCGPGLHRHRRRRDCQLDRDRRPLIAASSLRCDLVCEVAAQWRVGSIPAC
jgi:prepilin-type N-terminal cleavage/methylation domain-containing protein